MAQRYAANIANGRFLWRNRLGAESIEVRVARQKNGEAAEQWVFNAFDQNLRDLEAADADVASLAEVIEQGLAGDSHVLLSVEAYARVGAGQEVYPSQELLLDGKNQKDNKSKTLYQVGGIAGMHSQKIGNALRTIDTWYPGADELGPIAVEPYGSVTTQGKAYRQPKEKQDFYSLLDGWILKDKVPVEEQQHFVMATLVRGGVFGAKAD